MNLTILGSGASEGIPAFLCECAVCTHARRARGRDVRQNSFALVTARSGDSILIDLPPHFKMSWDAGRFRHERLAAVLVTHGHDDHSMGLQYLWDATLCDPRREEHPLPVYMPLDVFELRVRPRLPALETAGLKPVGARPAVGPGPAAGPDPMAGAAPVMGPNPVAGTDPAAGPDPVAGTRPVAGAAAGATAGVPPLPSPRKLVDARVAHAYQQLAVDPFVVTPLETNHLGGARENFGYLIEDADGKRIAYVVDAPAVLPDRTLDHLRARPLDCLVFECTFAQCPPSQGHSDVQGLRNLVAALKPRLTIATHIGHGNDSHRRLERILRPHGVRVAFDGMKVRI